MKMRRFSVFLVLACLFCSCEKVIDLKLANTAPKYVIEAVLTNQAGGARVSISQTKNFTADNTLIGIDGAAVSVESNGSVYSFTPSGNGLYQDSTLTGVPGNTYHLIITVDNTMVTATCTMPQPVALDSVYVVNANLTPNKDGSPRRYAVVRYKDPLAVKNFYRLVQYVNGNKEKTIFVENDDYTNGQVVNSRLDFSNDNDDPARNIETGRQLTIELQCIDAAVYKYWFSLNTDADGSGNNAAPANPVSNLAGNVLGYFSAHTVQRKTITVP